MANIFELNINLNEVGKSEAEQALKETTNGSAGDSGNDGNIELTNLEKAGKMLSGIHLAGQIDSNILRPLVNMGTNTIGSVYGDTARMNQINNLTNSVNTGMGFVRSGLSGYSVGSAFGNGAGVAMAIVNVVMDVAGEAISMIENSIQYNNQQLDYKYNSAYASERLGILATNKGR